ncbi:MAG TPA: hypothetical protein DDZ41_10775, partial [Flavobacterium sp.]|nr:hypothetical protein [Flavobacterium sp.]
NWRKNSLFNNGQENFTYDSQDRLTSYPNATGQTITQTYKEDGRIETNTLGTYNYAKTNKIYQNTSITATNETINQYQANQYISYKAFKSPHQIEQAGIDKLSFVYNNNNDRAVMFYGGVQNDKLQRPLRKYYSA